jgi:hypothetical protein
MRTQIVLAALLFGVAGCGGGDETTTDSATSERSTAAPATTAPQEPEGKAGEIVKSGFGQRDDFVWVTSLVKNNTDEAGATVTVQYNVLDATGSILVSGEQVESFSRGGELLAVGTQLEVPSGTEAATVEASLVVEPDGIGSEFQEIPTSPVTVTTDEFGQPTASFEVTNPTSEPLSPRIGVICYDSAGEIVGGTSEFPEVPPSGKARVDTLSLLVTGTPAECEAYAGGPL